HQETDGHFDVSKYGADKATDTSVTALALLAYLGGWHSEKVGMYRENVRLAVAWLISKQHEDGAIWANKEELRKDFGLGHPHALAGWALAEAAARARVESTRRAAQK